MRFRLQINTVLTKEGSLFNITKTPPGAVASGITTDACQSAH